MYYLLQEKLKIILFPLSYKSTEKMGDPDMEYDSPDYMYEEIDDFIGASNLLSPFHN